MKRARRHPPAGARVAATAATATADTGSTVVVPRLAPRNPFAPLAHTLHAGAHGGGARKRRQAEKRALKRMLEEE